MCGWFYVVYMQIMCVSFFVSLSATGGCDADIDVGKQLLVPDLQIDK